MAWSFWWPASIQEPIQSHLIRTKCALITQEIPRDVVALCHALPWLWKLQRSQELCARTWDQWSNIRTIDNIYGSGNYKGFRNSVSGTKDRDQIYICYHINFIAWMWPL
jgi:hypothetical protein